MPDSSQRQPTTTADSSSTNAPQSVPSIALPKGGGAIKGIGEKFAANPVTGTGSFSVPIAASPGRSGFGPQLSLSYDSGSGNGPFGFGWSLSIPMITRKTDKGLPRYNDAAESDIYLLSGAEDLVPELDAQGVRFEDRASAPNSIVHRYHPRVEGLFARIERWTDLTSGEIHWRTISKENITTWYGKTAEARIANPDDPQQIFTWLICESYDDKGNAIVYSYEAEDDANIAPSAANERNRVRTANRYLKRIRYGNQISRLIEPDLTRSTWLFELVFDYDQAHYEVLPRDPRVPEAAQHQRIRATAAPAQAWTTRPDPFSIYRSGFEVRTYRRCHRVLMFHHFSELGGEPCLVRSTEFDYADLGYSSSVSSEAELAHPGSTRIASFIQRVTQSGYVRDESATVLERNGIRYVTYLKKSLPPVEFEYSKARIQADVRSIDSGSLTNLPIGLDGAAYQWIDLDGEGLSGVLTEQAGAWFYKPNLGDARFGAMQPVASRPSLAALGGGHQQLLDLAGDGQLDLVTFAGPNPGFSERTTDKSWDPFRPFLSLPDIAWQDPNLRFIDLSGDGHADVLITEHQVFVWHPSLAEEGFGLSQRVYQPLDEERGPRLLLADGTQSIYLADMCGDGLTDLVRIRNGEVCYWPNLGYGRFGPKVTMDNAPWFDHQEQFSQQRIRLADIDGSGTNDIIYLGRDSVCLYFNQSGNRWSDALLLPQLPRVDNLTSVTTADLLGNGTACLVWSSPLPGDARQPLRYIDLMGGQKPHLLIKTVNNLGAETHIQYAASTKFYLADQADGRPWITKLPFPVHVVERVETFDRISRNHFVTRYAYHHGYFNGVEREFRGFGMVEQFDTETFAALTDDGRLPDATNLAMASHVPPVHTKTWFHTGIYLGREHVSDYFAGLRGADDVGEYYREPGLPNQAAQQRLLADTVLPDGLTLTEEREACRALRGTMLRQEVYALDGTERQQHPYVVTEQNFTITVVQAQGANRHAVFFTHAHEALSYHYERNPADPRVAHTLTLEVDAFGNVLKQATIAYGRRQPDLALAAEDRARQARLQFTYTESQVTNAVARAHDHRTPLPFAARTYEVGVVAPPAAGARLSFEQVLDVITQAQPIAYEQALASGALQKRLIEHVRTCYRKDDLSALLPLGVLEPLALPGESYKLAFTPGLLAQVYQRPRSDQPPENLLPDLADALGRQGGYVDLDGDGHWWIPSGRVFFSPSRQIDELAEARRHFFLPRRFRDPFHTEQASTESVISYDAYDLLMVETRDALGNRVTVGESDLAGTLISQGNDYRVMQPRLIMDPNRNRSAVAFDALGLVVATAVMSKPEERKGDTLTEAELNLTELETLTHLADPLASPHALLGGATTRLVYDLFAYERTQRQANPQPATVATLVRETHVADLAVGQQTKIQHSLSYSDGFGREIQKKIQAEPGLVPTRDANGTIIRGADGQPVMTAGEVSLRWVGSGWTVLNNKGKPVRQYEPFFSDTQRFEFDVRIGVSAVLFYDPVERVVATLHPNHTWEKVVFDPWQQQAWDVNDTVLAADPSADPDVGEFFRRLPSAEYLPTWHAERAGGLLGPQEQVAAIKAAAHASTPTTAYFDTLGRPFLTVADNGPDPAQSQQHLLFATRVELDIEGNQRSVSDALDRVVMRYDYDMLGNRIDQASMEAG